MNPQHKIPPKATTLQPMTLLDFGFCQKNKREIWSNVS